MNILFVAPDIPDKGQPTTGFPNYLYRVSIALIDMGHKPIILAAGNRNEKWNDRGIEIIRVCDNCIRFDNDSVNFVVNAFKKSCILNQEIKNIDSKIGIDIIQFTSLYGVSLLYNGNIPSVMRLSSYAKTYFATYQTYSKSYVKVMALVERMASRRCNAVFAPCRNTATAFGNDINRNVFTIETPFTEDITEYDMTLVNTQLNNVKYVLFFGTLYIEKGIKVIGNCLEKFLGNNLDYYFVFAGKPESIDGENAVKYLKRCAGKYVGRTIFFNELSHELLYPVIQNADFVVLPSIMDNLPNACIEAMYFGKVVIGTDGASFEQLIKHNVSGLLCKRGDSEDLLEKMQMAVSMENNQKLKMSHNARKRIELLKPEVAVSKLLKLYNKVIDYTK